MSQKEPVKHARRGWEVRRLHFPKMLELRGARKVGVINQAAADGTEEISLKFLAKVIVTVASIILIVLIMTQMSDTSIAIALSLLVAQAALVIFGLSIWLHKPRA